MAASEIGLLAIKPAYYDECSEKLLLNYPNRFLLIHGDSVIGDCETRSEAVAEGIRGYGRGAFPVRRTEDKTLELIAPALTLGLLQCRY